MSSKQTTLSAARKRTGYTLLEMVLSLSVMSIAFAAVGSVFVLASHVMPGPNTAEAATLDQSAALSQITEDLQVAKYITEHSANAITMVVDDRTGDSQPDRLRYAWSGTTGGPLTLSINGSAPVTLAEDVKHFALSLNTSQVVGTVPPQSTTSEETLLYAHTTGTTTRNRQIAHTLWSGQLITPTLPVGATSYCITRVQIRARRYNSGASGISFVKLKDVNGQLPGANTLGQVQLNESTLGNGYRWVPITFTTPVERPAGTPTALTIDSGMYTHGCEIQYDRGAGAGRLVYASASTGWTHKASQSMMIQVHGTYKVVTPGVTLTRTVFNQAKITLQVGTATQQTTRIQLYGQPGSDAATWGSTFDASPKGTDLSGDGADWVAQSGGAAGAFQNGRWNVDGVMYSQPNHNFDQPILVEATMGADAANRTGATLRINADQSGGQTAAITVQSGRDAAGKHYVRVYDTAPITTPRIEVTELVEHLPRIQLLIAPGDNAAALLVNGQPVGSCTYTPISASGNPGRVYLSEGSGGVFDAVRVHVGGTAVVTAGGG